MLVIEICPCNQWPGALFWESILYAEKLAIALPAESPQEIRDSILMAWLMESCPAGVA